ncbi:MAG: HK97 family phage prohead protease [Thiobacillus sp.]|nr:HK97 family phage prohead protease [Thiobacillus sp.]
MSMKRLYAEIAKTEAQEDGTIKVFGYASSGAEDSDGETITSDAMKAALPDYMKFGAVREMHDAKKAAGTAIEAEVQEDGRTWFGAHVVDPVAVRKCETGVYKGFSIGGKVTGRDDLNKKLIKSIKLVEVSLVDRPANPEAVFTMFKSETVDGQPGDEGETTEKNNDPGAGEELQKGMYGVARLADMLESIAWMARGAEDEAVFEGDSSPIPAQLRDWLKQGAVIFTGMAAEEVNELVAMSEAKKAEASEALQKAGARFSKATKAALGDLHKMVKAADEHLGKMGYAEAEEADDEQTKAETIPNDAGDALQKACVAAGCPEDSVATDWIAKVGGELSELRDLAKAAGVEGESPAALVNALVKRVSEQTQEITDLKKQPAPPKGYANGVALSKADDRAGVEAKEVAPVTASNGEENEVATLIKAAQANPIRIA